jgi:RNA polymerase sigma-70 factor (ECF subfamily)
MTDDELPPHLSRISTQWSVIFQAHQGGAEAVTEAQRQLMLRYGGAAYRYLLGLLRDPDAADELSQEFAVRFLRGDFRRVDPQRGRFRDFLKTALRNLVVDHHRRRSTRPRQLPADAPEPADPADHDPDLDRQFLDSWRRELLDRAWEALARAERETGQPLHTVLRFRADHPDLRSAQMAEQLGAVLDRAVSADWVRKTLERARNRFADLLLDDVAHSLDYPGPDAVEEELLDVGLLEYCRPALGRRGRGS